MAQNAIETQMSPITILNEKNATQKETDNNEVVIPPMIQWMYRLLYIQFETPLADWTFPQTAATKFKVA